MRIHFIGIGGIGVSALAQYYLAKGHKISGSDLAASEITELLKKKGATIFIGKHKANNLASLRCLRFYLKHLKDLPELVIYSPAITQSNPELIIAKKLKIECQSYPEALGKLTKRYWTIAVCGTHGKSTTAAMISLILIKAGLDPTVIIGTKLKEFGNTNFRMGGFPQSEILNLKSKILIIEADEWQASFLNYWPKMIVLTNIEREHLDYYKGLGHILRTYEKFISHLPPDGVLVANKDDAIVYQMIKKSKIKTAYPPTALPTLGRAPRQKSKIIYYSLAQKEAKEITKTLKIPGKHNVANALAALSAVRYTKIPNKIIYQALSEYNGSWRRFEIKRFQVSPKHPPPRFGGGATGQAGFSPAQIFSENLGGQEFQVVHDYGHHPTEIKATLEAAREKWPEKQIWLIFQPHQYQRTYYLFQGFVNAFRKMPINRAIITDIYDVAGRENKEIKAKIGSKELVEAIKKSYIIYLKKAQILDYLREQIRQIRQKQLPIIIVMGAGDIYQLFNTLNYEMPKNLSCPRARGGTSRRRAALL